jgi:hypothetical protein
VAARAFSGPGGGYLVLVELEYGCRSYVKQRMIIGAVPVIGVGVLLVLMLLFERDC